MQDIGNLCSDKQTVAIAQGAVLSDKSIDLGLATAGPLGTPIHDIGRGREVPLLIQMVESLASLGAATIKVELVMADDAALTSNLVVLWDSGAIAKAVAVAGYQFRCPCVPFGVTKRYLGFRYTIGAADATAGKVVAGIVFDRQQNPSV
jgi:hypothetical protein